ncbi:VanZ family protein [Streptosporangium carneum]|uniref:VanZ-like domain-containing protein n=1 Tax=Streptosporangium carneum TaxID=47481 RepID=A0A9W6MFN5_9ACTN|nr:VanZ family protein [Streptosporangium carneum]GLK12073.1 hypothetical protein GCM10017600_54810 [Streptosporangium carneum]
MPVPVEVFFSNRDLWTPVACLLAVLVGLSIPLSAKAAVLFRSNRLVTFCSLACLAVIAALTLPTRFSSHRQASCTLEGLPGIVSLADPQNLLNASLYVPAAFLGVLVTRRLSAVAVGLAATSVSIELAQLLSDRRNCNLTDMLFNTLGALVGVALAAVVLHRGIRGGLPRETGGGRPR